MKALEIINTRYTSISFALSYIILGVAAAHLVGFAVPGLWALPLVNAGLFFILYQAPLRRGDYSGAVRLALIWAVVSSLLQIGLTLGWPGFMEEKIWRALEYREEMFGWVQTGKGPEGDIRLFIPIHLKHFLIFSAVSLISGGFLGLALGSALLGYMNFYVGCLIAEAANTMAATCLSWPVWAIVRVVGFIVAGTALGAILIHREGAGSEKYFRIRCLFGLALVLMILDIVLKWALAGTYQKLLNAALTHGG